MTLLISIFQFERHKRVSTSSRVCTYLSLRKIRSFYVTQEADWSREV